MKRLALDTPARVLMSLALGCFATTIVYAAEANFLWHDVTRAAPEFGRYGVALAFALLIYQWHRRRINRIESARLQAAFEEGRRRNRGQITPMPD